MDSRSEFYARITKLVRFHVIYLRTRNQLNQCEAVELLLIPTGMCRLQEVSVPCRPHLIHYRGKYLIFHPYSIRSCDLLKALCWIFMGGNLKFLFSFWLAMDITIERLLVNLVYLHFVNPYLSFLQLQVSQLFLFYLICFCAKLTRSNSAHAPISYF